MPENAFIKNLVYLNFIDIMSIIDIVTLVHYRSDEVY